MHKYFKLIPLAALILTLSQRGHAETATQALAKAYQKNYIVQKHLPRNTSPAQREVAARKIFAKADQMIAKENAKKEADKLQAIAELKQKAVQKLKEKKLAKKDGKGKARMPAANPAAAPANAGVVQNRVNTTGTERAEAAGAKEVQFGGKAAAPASKVNVSDGIIQDR